MLTRSGTLVAASTAGLLLLGWAAGYPELVALGLAGGAALLAAVVSVIRRADITATRRIEPSRVAEGARAVGVLTVTNTGRRRSPPILATESVAGSRVTVALPGLAAGQSHETAYPLPTARRGRYQVDPLIIGRSDPLRLFRVGRRCGEPSTLYVHPGSHLLAHAPADGTHALEGPTSSYAPRGGVAFHSLRAYEPADDWRLIHWKSSARSGQLMVRHNVVPNEPRHVVVLDTSAAGYTDESFEDAVRVAASLCRAFAATAVPVEVRTTGGRISAGPQDAGSGGGIATMLDLLAEAERSPSDPGLPGLSRLAPDGDGGILAVVTGPGDRDRLAVLAAIRPRFLTVSLVQVGDRSRRPGPQLGGIASVSIRTSKELPAAWNQVASL
jgi:uncharacterized protein (DUF58 family)